MAASTFFSDVESAPPIEVFKLTADYKEDKYPNKVNLGVGAYRTADGKPWVLPVVKSVESQMAVDATLNKEYLPVAGLMDYRRAGVELLLGENSPAIRENRSGAVQALGGTGALRVGLAFLHKVLGASVAYASRPTWGNHHGICKNLGFKETREYRLWDEANRCVDMNGLLQDLEDAPEGAVILLHMCCHNPTGMDPTLDQWGQIADVMKRKKLFPFFDCAYQGFGSGDLVKDAASIHLFVERGFELFAAQSFSKNFGLYNERVGNCIIVANDAEVVPRILSQMELIVRQTYSNPPAHGCRIVATILNNPALKAEWMGNVQSMAERILSMRADLHSSLRKLGTPGNWDHIVHQKGMFSYTGLNAAQVDFLVKEKHIYLMKSGRINMCGLNSSNMEYVAQSIHEAVCNVNKL